MDADSCPDGGWASLSSDLLALVSDAVPARTRPVLLLVCKPWNRGLKQTITVLQPAYFDAPWEDPYAAVAVLLAPVARPMFDGALIAHLPLWPCHFPTRSAMAWAGAPPPLAAWFPSLHHLDLSAQSLALPQPPQAASAACGTAAVDSLPSMLHAVAASSNLQSLDLSRCRLALGELSSALTQLLNVRSLCLSGIQPTDATWASAPGRLLPALARLPRLCALDLSLAPPPPPPLNPLSAPVQPPALALSLTRCASHLLALTALTTLALDRHRLTAADVATLGLLTNLSSLSIGWYGRDADSRLGLTGASMFSLHSLTALTSLRISMFGRRGIFQELGLRLAPSLSRLVRLGLPGCCDPGLVLSIRELGCALLELDLSHAWLGVTPELVVQVASLLPNLTALDVSHSRWGGANYGQLRLPGDELLGGLCAVRPELVTLRMQGVAAHGTGFRLDPTAAPGHAGLPLVRDLALPGGLLLRSKLRELGQLSELRRLTLSDVSPEEFLAASKVGGYLPLGRLSCLTALRILRPRPAQNPLSDAGGPAGLPHAFGALQPGPLHADLEAEEGEPMEDGWVPVEFAGQGAAEGQQQQQQPPQQQQHAQLAQAEAQLAQLQQAQQQLAQLEQAQELLLEQAAAGHEALGNMLAELQGGGGDSSSGGSGSGSGSGDDEGASGGEAEEAEEAEEDSEGDDEGDGGGAGGGGGLPLATGSPGGGGGGPALRPEPHLRFASALSQLQVLVLTCLATSGLCFRHLTGLTALRVLHLGGQLAFTPDGLAAMRGLQLPALQSLQIMTCSFAAVPAPGAGAAGSSSSAAHPDVAGPWSAGPSAMAVDDGYSADETYTAKPMPQQEQAAAQAQQRYRHGVRYRRQRRHSLGAGPSASTAPPPPPLPPPPDSGLHQLLSNLAHALGRTLEHLELGDCRGLTEATLRSTLQGLPRLRYLVLHGQPLGMVRCRAVLESAGAGTGGTGGARGRTCVGGLRYFASWCSPAAAQVAAGAVQVPGGGSRAGGGGGAGSSGGGGPWPACWSVPGAAAAGEGAGDLPGATFFSDCPPSSLNVLGPWAQGGFVLSRVGRAMLPQPVPQAA